MKKSILFITTFFLVIMFFACSNDTNITTVDSTIANPTTVSTVSTSKEVTTDFLSSVVDGLGIPSEVEENFYLPLMINGVSVSYSVASNDYLSISPDVTTFEDNLVYEFSVSRPSYEDLNQTITITATFNYNGIESTKDYDLVVLAYPASYYLELDEKIIESSYVIENEFVLPTPVYSEYGAVTISSSISDYLSYSEGVFTVNRPDVDTTGVIVIELSYKDDTSSVTIDVTIKKAVQVIEGSTLIISEYVEGSSYNKYLELYNPTLETLDLSEYTLETYFNGKLEATGSLILSGSLASGHTIVIGNPQGTLYSPDLFDSSAINFNGNDVIVLLFNGVIIDSIGKIGNDSDFAKDITLVRKPGITSGDVNPNDEFNLDEWEEYQADTTTYLGSHTS
ncbi:MAG: lamin tail domain-containing protein [Candidatus Izemoplasmatales bacterium]